MMNNAFVDIWTIPLTLELPENLPLSAAEMSRAREYQPAPRRTFVIGRYAVRCILAAYLQTLPEQVMFQTNAFGKPSLAGISSEIQFNVSHSADLAVCAVTQSAQIGIDIEYIRLIEPIDDMQAMAQLYFADQEYQQFMQLPVAEQLEAFFALWTRKEAFIKGVGQGLAHPLNNFCVPFNKTAINNRMRVYDAETGADKGWSLFAFQPEPHYMAAVAIEGAFLAYPSFKRFPGDIPR